MKPLAWMLPLGAGLAALVAWFAFAASVHSVAGPGETAQALWIERQPILVVTGRLIGVTLLAYAIAAVLGLSAALLMMRYRGLRLAGWPWAFAGNLAPLAALAPVAVLATPTGPAAALAVGTVCGFFTVVTHTMPALLATDKALLDLFRAYRATAWQEIRYLRLPHALPSLLAGLRRAAILTPLVAALTDFLAGALADKPGAGQLLARYAEAHDPAAVTALCLVVTLAGLLLAGAAHAFSAWALLHWHDGHSTQH